MQKAPPRFSILPVICSGLLLVTSAFFTYRHVVPSAIVGWDEAAYLLSSAEIRSDLASLNVRGLVADTRKQYIFPPLQSWFLGSALLPSGFTVGQARTATLFWFLAGGIMLYATALLLPDGKRIGTVAGFLALFLYVISPMNLVFAGLALKETMGMALTLAAAFAYFRSRDSTGSWPWIAGALAAALFLTKYNYGAVFILAMGIDWILGFRSARNIRLRKDQKIMAFVIALCVGGWILATWPDILGYFSSQNEMTSGMGTFVDRLLFYPRSVVYLYSPGPFLGLTLIAGFLLSLRYFGNERVRFLILLVLVNAALVGAWINNLHDRYIFTVVPFLFLLVSWQIAGVAGFRFTKAYIVMLTVLGLLLLGNATFRDMVLATGSHTLRFPLFNERTYTDDWLGYDKRTWIMRIPTQDFRPDDVFSYIRRNIDTGKPYEILGFSNILSPKLWRLSLATEPQHPSPVSPAAGVIVTIEILPDSRYATKEYRDFGMRDAREIEMLGRNPSYRVVGKKIFDDIGVAVTVFEPGQPLF